MKRIWRVLPYTLAVLLLLTRCGTSSVNAVGPEEFSEYSGEVVLYCSMQEKQIQKLKAGFEKRYPYITMQYDVASTGKILTKLATEQQTGHVAADLVWIDSAADYIPMKEKGILAPYVSPQAINIHPAFIDEDHYYTGARILSFVIAYNTDLVPESQAPRSWQELLDPKWKGKIIMTDPGEAGSAKHFVGAMLLSEAYGEEYFTQLRDNGCMLETSTTGTHMQVAQGNYPIGIGLDDMVETMAESGEPIAGIWPEQDAVFLSSPIAMVEKGPNPRNARLLYDYILSEEGQSILKGSHLRGIRDDEEPEGPDIETILPDRLPIDHWLINEKAGEILTVFDQIFFGGRTTPR